MNNKNLHVMIMAGGIGSRLWPLSTHEKPKQFVDVLGLGKSLLQSTYERMLSIVDADKVWVLTNAAYQTDVLNQLPILDPHHILCEPERKNTAPCIAYAAAKCWSENPDSLLIIVPSDHIILNLERFKECIHKAIQAAEKGGVVTLGIKPTRPDTGYGYIEVEKDLLNLHEPAKPVHRFCEKPSLETAKDFLRAGNYFWNAGIFIAAVTTLKEAFKSHAPSLHEAFYSSPVSYHTDEELALVQHAFATVPNISFDFAVMEKAENVMVIPSDFDWSDLGTWGSIEQMVDHDRNGNSIVQGRAYLSDTQNCLIHISNGNHIFLAGVKDLMISESEGKILIAHKDKEPSLKADFEQLCRDNTDFPA
ncbi:MAG: mannose-1-phosphate guanylyltransferase [Flavobacteriales bacterium]